MEIKITCGCGQKYIFEVDPENGQMPAAVNCPACGADGTQEANDIMAQIFPESAAEPTVEAAEPPPAVTGTGPLRINPPVHPSAAAGVPPPISAPKTIGPPKSPSSKLTLTWYEHVWAALPLCLVILGGAIGGACGGAAWVLNRAVFQKVEQPVLRYVFTGLISAAAVVVWLVVASLLFGLLHKR